MKLIKKYPCTFFTIFTLISTWTFTGLIFIDPKVGTQWFPFIMFIPAITVLLITSITREKRPKIFSFKMISEEMSALISGILYPYLFISGISILAIITLNSHIKYSELNLSLIIYILINSALGILLVLGEEYGWRGYLLPRLTKSYGKVLAPLFVGLIWALFHFPAVFLLSKYSAMKNPILISVIQSLVSVNFSYPFAFIQYKSKTLLPVLAFHSVWNTINTVFLGDIYTNNPGIIIGNIGMINGEGVLGLFLSSLLSIIFILILKYSTQE